MPFVTKDTFTFDHTAQPDYPNWIPSVTKTNMQAPSEELRLALNAVVNLLNATGAGVSGANNTAMTPIPAIGTQANVQTVVEAIVTRLQAVTASLSGAKFIGVETIAGLTGNDVQVLLTALKTLADGYNTAQSNALNAHKSSGDHSGIYYLKTEIDTAINILNGVDTAQSLALTTHKLSLDHTATKIPFDNTGMTKLTGTTVQQALAQAETELKAFIGVNANAEVGSAHISAVKAKTFTDLGGRFEEIEQDRLSDKAQTANLTISNTGKLPIKSYDMSYWLRPIDRRIILGPGGFLIARMNSMYDDMIAVYEKQQYNKNYIHATAGFYITAIAYSDVMNGRFLMAKGDGFIYQFSNSGAWSSGLTLTAPAVVNAMCIFTYPWASAVILTTMFVACDSTRLIYNLNYSTGAVNYSFAYPTGLINASGMCTDGYSIFVSDKGSTVYRIHTKTGVVVETIVLPVQCEGGISFYDGCLYVGDSRKSTVFVLPLGGKSLQVAGNPKVNLTVSDLFTKKNIGILDGAQEPTCIYENGVFKLWCTKDALPSIYYATSTDGINFGTATKVFGNGVGGESGYARLSYVFKNGTTYYMVYASNSANTISYATSSDGINWTKQGDIFTITQLNSAGWAVDAGALGNLGVYFDGSQWVMWVESKGGSATWNLGRITSPDLVTWTIDTVWPRIAPYEKQIGLGGPQPFLHGGKHYMIAHESMTGSLPSVPILLFSNDGLNWGKAPANPLLNWSDVYEVDQMADPCLIEANGKLYLYYAANNNNPGKATFKLSVATADITLDGLLATMGV